MISAALGAAVAAPAVGIEAYTAQRLDVVEAPVSTIVARGYDGDGRFWFVVDGAGAAVTARELALRSGQQDLASSLRRRQTGRWATAAGVLLLGAAAASSVLVADDPWLQAAGFTGGAAGLVGSGFVARSTLRLRHPSIAWTQDEATTTVRACNATLRERLLPAEPAP